MNKKPEMNITLDWETADRIAVATLQNYLETCEQELDNYHRGSWMHPDDVVHTNAMVKALKFVLRDFGVQDE